ncbi:hotdog fold thioesterase [Nevskia sp.]|uniref:hotdog fold thioesterase n=1 Tax=Nevskia sp. TaxID=1929292 RepID=UPI0025F13558|nr:hotdog fold thioesterase [Nevskia sp.]
MSIWKQPVTIGQEWPIPQNSLGGHLGLKVTEIGVDYLRGTMPVDHRTVQPFGRLHGGASCVLAEELGSIAAFLCIPPGTGAPVGLDINANHIRPPTSGIVIGTARPLHIGRSTQVWEIRIVDEQDRLVCISRLTVSVIALDKAKPVA